MSWHPRPRGGLIVQRRLRAAIGDLAAFAVGPVDQLLHQLTRLARLAVGRARGHHPRLRVGQRPVTVSVHPVGARIDVASEPLPEPLPLGGLRGRLDAQRGGRPPSRAQVPPGGSQLGLQAALGLLRCSATTERRGQRKGSLVKSGLPDSQEGGQRV